MRLRRKPNRDDIHVKPLKGSDAYRLRVRGWRILFRRKDEDGQLRIVFEVLATRGQVYKKRRSKR